MSTLHDLRATLGREAATVHDTATAARVAAVRGRARAVRRRRTAAGAVAAALVVGGASTAALLTGGAPDPADGHLIGDHVAPGTMTSLGWEYDFERGVHEDSTRLVLTLPDSDTPTLLSWAADEPGPVEVFDGGRQVYSSAADDFTDFVVLPPGGPRRVFVDASEPGVAAATYTLDPAVTPPGVGEGQGTFRSEAGGRRLLGAAYGEPGETSVEVDLVLPERGQVWVTPACQDVPRGYVMHVTQSGVAGEVISGACPGSVSDPGGSPNMGLRVGSRGGEPATFRMWVTPGPQVEDGGTGDSRLGLGVYDDGRTTRAAGMDLPVVIESGGHTWELADIALGPPDDPPAMDLPDGGPWLASVTLDAPGVTGFRLLDDGVEVDGGAATGVTSSFGEMFLPDGTGRRVAVTVDQPGPGALALAVYGLADR